MNSKMTTNSQLSTTEPKKKTKNKLTTRRETESQKWRSQQGGEERMREKVQGIRSINGRYKMERGT